MIIQLLFRLLSASIKFNTSEAVIGGVAPQVALSILVSRPTIASAVAKEGLGHLTLFSEADVAHREEDEAKDDDQDYQSKAFWKMVSWRVGISIGSFGRIRIFNV